jgi:hypothetical protein
MRRVLVALLLLAACATPQPPLPATIPAGPELDIAATVLAAYNVVSGPAGRRDWDRFKELFAPNAHIVLNGASMTPDEFQKSVNDELQKNPLFEQPVATRIDRAGGVAQVWTRYESRRAAMDDVPFAHGVRAFQLIRIGEEWRIVSMLMQPE